MESTSFKEENPTDSNRTNKMNSMKNDILLKTPEKYLYTENLNQKNSNKSTSAEKQDLSEEPSLSTQTYNNVLIKGKARKKPKISINKQFENYYTRMKDYEKKKLEKINAKRKLLEKNEISELKTKPEISKKSKEMMNGNNNLFGRMKESEKKVKEKKIKLMEKIKLEREKKKEEEKKPIEYHINKKSDDKKFNEVYQNMINKVKQAKENLEAYKEAVEQYEMKECVFQPNLETEEDDEKNKTKKLTADEITKRLYTEGIKKKLQDRENLEKKYKPSFKPKISDNTKELAKKWKERNKLKKEEKEKELKISNSLKKRVKKRNKIKDTDLKTGKTADNIKTIDKI